MTYSTREKSIRMFIYAVITVSIFMNVFYIIRNFNYKYMLGELSYTEIENIKHKNESNLGILLKSTECKSIQNQDLLKIHKNYESISNSVIELWQQYNKYEDNSLFIFSKRIPNDKSIENDVHSLIKEYTLSALNNEMKNEKTKLVLEDENLTCFELMSEIATEINNYFNNFNEEYFRNTASDIRKDKIIKKLYWIDMLDGINGITEEYVDTEWSLTVSSEELN